MTKKRASLAGRGVEILFGGESEDSSEEGNVSAEETTTPANAEETPGDESGESMESEWAAMLGAEAATAAGDSVSELDAVLPTEPTEEGAAPLDFTAEDGRPDWPVAEIEPTVDEIIPASEETAEQPTGLPLLATAPAQPAEELPSLATTPATSAGGEAVAAPMGETGAPAYTPPMASSVPIYEPETPPAPTYTEPSAQPGEAPASLPPPRDKPEAYDPVVRARLVGALYQTDYVPPSEEDLLPDGPRGTALELRDIAEFEVGQPSRTRREREVLDYVGLKQRQALWQEISEMYRQVPEVLSTDELHDEALTLLQKAQDILMEKPRQFDVAQYCVSQVRTILIRRKNTTRWTNTYGWATFLYEVLWIVALSAAILFAPVVVNWIEGILGTLPSFIVVADLWNTSAWGAVGGVAGALYSLYWHAAHEKDFDKQYIMWYIVQPVFGVIIGAAIYIFFGAGLINIIGESGTGVTTPLDLFPYAVAWLAGFRQRFILELVDRFVQFVTGAEQRKQQEQAAAAPATEAPPAPPTEVETPPEES
jgi:hypothetical protein